MNLVQMNEHNNDVRKIDISKLEQLLHSGRKDSCRDVLENVLDEIGYSLVDSLMLRLYISMDIYVSVRTYTKKLGISNETFMQRFGSIDEIQNLLAARSSVADYFSDMLEQSITWRTELSRDGSDVIDKAKEYISENYSNEDISMRSVAEAVSLSPAYFSSLFKKSAGISFVDYLNGLRISKAKELLCRTSMQISEIAYSVGFRDYRYFGQIFKKHTGKTPREFHYSSTAKD